LIKNFQPFAKKCQITSGGGGILDSYCQVIGCEDGSDMT